MDLHRFVLDPDGRVLSTHILVQSGFRKNDIVYFAACKVCLNGKLVRDIDYWEECKDCDSGNLIEVVKL